MTTDYRVGWHIDAPPAPRRRSRLPFVAFLLALVVLAALVRPTWADEGDVRAVIADRAAAHGVSAWALTQIALCESRLDPGAVGDHGHSHGLVQLSDLPGTGLLWDFYARGYGSPYSAWESADYLAAVAAGEYRGVYLSRWSCWR